MGLCQGAEEKVDGRTLSTRFLKCLDVEMAVGEEDAAVGRDDVDVIGMDGGLALDLLDWHPGMRLQQFGQKALPVRVHVGDYHKDHAGVTGHSIKKALHS